MLFNVLAYNRDDHAKNFSFCMDDRGEWVLSPAYDLLFTDSDLGGNWMLVQGKRTKIRRADFEKLSDLFGIQEKVCSAMISEVTEALRQWPDLAKQSGVDTGLSNVVNTSIQAMIELL